MISNRVLRDAVQVADVLEHIAGTWITAEQFQLGISSRRMYKALRFLIEQRLIQSRIVGEGTARYKEYRTAQVGFPQIVEVTDSEAR